MEGFKEICTRVQGERQWWKDIMPLDGNDNLLANTSFDKKGYMIRPFLPEIVYENYIEQVLLEFNRVFNSKNIDFDSSAGLLGLEKYHEFVGERHLDVVNELKHINSCNFPIGISVIEDRISEILGFKVTNYNPITSESVYHYRIIRPQMPDYNPIHRDTWHSEYENCINIYVPICGSNELSSLPLMEGSHHLNDNMFERTPSGAVFNGIQFTVPAVTDSSVDVNFVRPNPKTNEVMMFSPYLIHGAAANWNTDITRISLEMRFWRAKE